MMNVNRLGGAVTHAGYRLLLPAVLIVTAAAGRTGGAVAERAARSTASGCPYGTVCDRALGVALTVPSGWRRVPPGHFPRHTLVWYEGPPVGLDYNIRLLVGPDGMARGRTAARAAANAASALIAGYRGRVHITRRSVRYGTAPGVLIRGLPGGEGGPAAEIILAHRGVLYSIIAPGTILGRDQRRALAGLRFIRRVGRFPSANPPASGG